jgi:5-methylcytosine-specific restriction endonuclease McrA
MILSGAKPPTVVTERRYVRVDSGCLWFDEPKYQWRDITTCLTLDHVIPYLHGGAFKVANLQALCDRCNGRKGATL